MDPRCSQHWESSLEDLSVTTPLLPLHDDGGATEGRRSCSALTSRLLANKYLAIAAGPLASALVCSFVDFGDGRAPARNMLGALAWVFVWWLTDAVPLGVASMAPLFLFPAFGISSSDAVAKAYMDDVISLVLGSFILALAIEHYNIHRRLALNITSLFCGDPVKPPLLLLGICGTTMFISMWIHNTPCTVMMMPVATGILQRFPRGEAQAGADAREVRRFSKALVLGVTYASTIGGMSTLTGTGANIILVGMWSTYFPEQRPITFSSWMSFGFPVALVLFLALWVTLCLMYCSNNTGRALSAYLDRTHLRRELSLLGPMAFAEKMVLAVFGCLILAGPDCPMDDEEPDERHPWVGSPLRWQSWGWNSHHHDGDSALHNPDGQGRRREAHGLGQVPEAAVEHHPPPRRRLRHRRGIQGQRPDGHPLGGARLPQGRVAAAHRARGLRLQRRHHGVHLRRRRHHAGAAAARRAGQHHRRAPAAAHGPRHRRRAALLPAAHRLATQRRRLRHRLHHHQGYGAHRDTTQSRRRCNSRNPTANARFCGFRHGLEVNT